MTTQTPTRAAADTARPTTSQAVQTELAVRLRPRVRVATAEELNIPLISGSMDAVPDHLRPALDDVTTQLKSMLASQTQRYLTRLAALAAERSAIHANGSDEATPQAGEVSSGNYVGWDLITISPIQLEAMPPYRPSKVVASGELSVLQAVLFINPAVSVADGFAVPANVMLGNRTLRLSFDRLNLTTGAPVGSFVFMGVLPPAPVPPLILFQVIFNAPAVITPQIIEVNVTADIIDLGQPFASFATWHVDMDEEPRFLSLGPVGPRFEYDIPQRYMVYPK